MAVSGGSTELSLTFDLELPYRPLSFFLRRTDMHKQNSNQHKEKTGFKCIFMYGTSKEKEKRKEKKLKNGAI